MVARRACVFVKANGEPCRAPPLRGGEFCRMHDPGSQEEVMAARRLGGIRRRRERATAEIYGVDSLDSVERIQRVLAIAVMDCLALENSVARVRALGSLVTTALRVLRVGQLERQVRQVVALEAVVNEQGMSISERLERWGGALGVRPAVRVLDPVEGSGGERAADGGGTEEKGRAALRGDVPDFEGDDLVVIRSLPGPDSA